MASAVARVEGLLLENMHVTVGVFDLIERYFVSASKLVICDGAILSDIFMAPRFILTCHR
jgi:hypothetical protein